MESLTLLITNTELGMFYTQSVTLKKCIGTSWRFCLLPYWIWTTTLFFIFSENPVRILHLNQVLYKLPYVALSMHHNPDLQYPCISASLRKDSVVCTELREELKFVQILPLHEDAQRSVTRRGLDLALIQAKTPIARTKGLVRYIFPLSN